MIETARTDTGISEITDVTDAAGVREGKSKSGIKYKKSKSLTAEEKAGETAEEKAARRQMKKEKKAQKEERRSKRAELESQVSVSEFSKDNA